MSKPFSPYLLKMFTESNSQITFPPVQHFTGHQGIKECRASKWHAEIETEEPPVFYFNVKLQRHQM